MNACRRILLGIFITVLVTSAFAESSSVPATRKIPRLLQRQVIALEELISEADATGSDHQRTYHFIDIDGDGTDDAVVFSTVGVNGGVGYTQYMFVFLSRPIEDAESDGVHWKLIDYAKIGAKVVRLIDFNFLQVTGTYNPFSYTKYIQFHLHTMEYQGTDGACCPSGKGFAVFEIKDEGRLIEGRTTPEDEAVVTKSSKATVKAHSTSRPNPSINTDAAR